jgi:DNA-binding NtrC family response regulator
MPAQTESILVVEDNPGVALVLQLMLEGEGYRVLTAASVTEALETLRRTPVDLVLTDAFSPSPERALESVTPIRTAAGSTPVALMTGHEVLAEDARAAGYCAVIRKPFDFDTLLDQIRECLSGSGVPS